MIEHRTAVTTLDLLNKCLVSISGQKFSPDLL